jgi:hypothetical protein
VVCSSSSFAGYPQNLTVHELITALVSRDILHLSGVSSYQYGPLAQSHFSLCCRKQPIKRERHDAITLAKVRSSEHKTAVNYIYNNNYKTRLKKHTPEHMAVNWSSIGERCPSQGSITSSHCFTSLSDSRVNTLCAVRHPPAKLHQDTTAAAM